MRWTLDRTQSHPYNNNDSGSNDVYDNNSNGDDDKSDNSNEKEEKMGRIK